MASLETETGTHELGPPRTSRWGSSEVWRLCGGPLANLSGSGRVINLLVVREVEAQQS